MSNREIKFRAWDESKGKFVDPRYDNVELSAIFQLPFYKFQQFTGLKDKNGVEIYEGDVVLRKGNGDPEDDAVGAIEYSPLAAMFVRCLDEHYKTSINVRDAQHLEVIGNIYQNPELASGNPENRASFPTLETSGENTK